MATDTKSIGGLIGCKNRSVEYGRALMSSRPGQWTPSLHVRIKPRSFHRGEALGAVGDEFLGELFRRLQYRRQSAVDQKLLLEVGFGFDRDDRLVQFVDDRLRRAGGGEDAEKGRRYVFLVAGLLEGRNFGR